MDSPLAIAKYFVPQIPSLAYASAQHTLGFSPTSSKWDLRTELTIHVLRHFVSGKGREPSPISKAQGRSLVNPEIKGKIWVAKATIRKPAPQDENIEDAVLKAVEDMASGQIQVQKPGLTDVEVEWTGFRSAAGNSERLPAISEEEKYQRLLDDPSRTSDTTILYFHGGAYYLCDPSTHRPVCSKLAKASKGKVCSIRYRLAPQTAFPGQLLDALMVYLSLLYPPEGSMHTAIPARHIVLGGDSAGGNLAFALVQFLLQLHRNTPAGATPRVRFHGRDVDVPLPAGASANSGWFDISRSMPSGTRNAGYDYLPEPHTGDASSRYPPDHIWPTTPRRGDLFCDLSLLDHPLVSPVVADSWQGAPPLWMCTGEEMLSDEDCVVAARAAQQGCRVHFEQYEAMPHCFGLIFPHLVTAERCVRSWGEWARRCVEEPGSLQTNGTFIYAKSGKEKSLSVENVGGDLSLDEAKKYVAEAKARRFQGSEKEGKMMPKPAL